MMTYTATLAQRYRDSSPNVQGVPGVYDTPEAAEQAARDYARELSWRPWTVEINRQDDGRHAGQTSVKF